MNLKTSQTCFAGLSLLGFIVCIIYASLLPSTPIATLGWSQDKSPKWTAKAPRQQTFIGSKIGITLQPGFANKRENACTSLVYIKTHKTGSTTLQTIVNRFGFFQNLSFVFNKQSATNGHFYFLPMSNDSLMQNYLLPPLQQTVNNVTNVTNNVHHAYDILAVHARYNKTAIDRLMKKGAKYITIIREPSRQWESAFAEFSFQDAFENASAIPEEFWIQTFLQKPEYYRDKLLDLTYEKDVGRRFYYSQNSQMYDLGLETNFFKNDIIINGTINRLDTEFSLVLIAEYFDESLLLLKKLFGWEYEDIVYISKNIRAKRSNLTNKITQSIRKWNRADVYLYEHFNRTLWRKVEEYGSEFEEDLKYFRKLNKKVFKLCGNPDVQYNQHGKRLFNLLEFLPKKNATLFCQTIAEHKTKLFKRIYARQNAFKAVNKKKSNYKSYLANRKRGGKEFRSWTKSSSILAFTMISIIIMSIVTIAGINVYLIFD